MFNQKEYMKKYRQEHKETAKNYMKIYREEHKEDKKEYMKQYREGNKIYIKENKKQYYQNNKKHHQELMKEWRKNHPEYIKEYDKEWHRNNPEYNKQYRKNNPEYINEWYKTEKGKALAQRSRSKRRSKLREITNTLTANEWIDILKQYKFRCAYCGKEFTLFDRETRDHVIPISKGGDNTKENVVPACQSCNSKKGINIFKGEN